MTNKTRHTILHAGQACTLVYQKQVLVALTRQLGAAQVEACECSQVTQLGWDAT